MNPELDLSVLVVSKLLERYQEVNKLTPGG